ncbi:hypothetical protein [Fictibacillus macauensis]|nr:hypothetical protein [Fictibacillus macauensis]
MKVKNGVYKQKVTVLKMKKGIATVIEVDGHVYQLQNVFRNNGGVKK